MGRLARFNSWVLHHYDAAGGLDRAPEVIQNPLVEASGSNGQVEFNGSSVHITRHGFAGGASHLEPWSMPVTAMTDVLLHEPSGLIPGFISFVTRSHVAPTGYVSAANDEQTVLFKRKQANEIEAVRTAVLAAISR